jgi:hypothetical protein
LTKEPKICVGEKIALYQIVLGSRTLVAHAVIAATQEAEIRRIMVRSQPRQIVCETLPCKNPSQESLVE